MNEDWAIEARQTAVASHGTKEKKNSTELPKCLKPRNIDVGRIMTVRAGISPDPKHDALREGIPDVYTCR